MSKEMKLIPELRFPEFENEGEWHQKALDETCNINPSSPDLPSEFVYIDLESVDAGKLLKKNKINRENAPSRAQRLLDKGDIIFQMVRPYQKNNLLFDIESELNFVASTGYAQLRAFQSGMYLYQYLHTDKFVSRVLSKCTGSNYPAINSSSLSKIRVELPQPQEQQKIASCLSSLDELIAAHNEKLDALKAHKKGLLQNLFPQEGETAPKVRFPEFEGDGEWRVEELNNHIDFQTGYPFKSSNFNDTGKGVRLVKNRDLKYDDGIVFYDGDYNEEYIINNGDILVGMDGDFTPRYWNKGKALLNQRVGRVKAKNKQSERFFEYFLSIKLQEIEKNTARTTVKHLSHSVVEKIKAPLPQPQEQQKIASCLSAVDALITAQQEKIEQLQQHKKGLMQGLFPNPSASSGETIES